MDDFRKNRYIRRLMILSTILFSLFGLIALSANVVTSIYMNTKQLDLCNVARENDAYNATVCFFKEDYSYTKASFPKNQQQEEDAVCKNEYTLEEMKAADFVDTDKDGIPDECDTCPKGDDANDSDKDGVPDDCDVCPKGDDTNDSDNDGTPDDCEK